MDKTFDIKAKIFFLTTEKGGWKHPKYKTFGVTFIIEKKYYHCMLKISHLDKTVYPGSTVVVPISFLQPELILPLLKTGKRFHLWSGGVVAEGVVEEIARQ